MASTFIADVAAVATDDAWSLGAGGSKVAAVLRPDDSDTSYITHATATGAQTFSTNASSLPFQLMTGSLTIHSRHRKTVNNTSFQHRWRHSGNVTDDAGDTVTSTSYANFSSALANVPGGSGWTDPQIKAVEIGFELTANEADRCTTLYMSFSADFVPNGFVSMVAQWLPLIGANLAMVDIMAMVNLAAIRRRVRVTAEELPRLLQELRSYTFPVTVS